MTNGFRKLAFRMALIEEFFSIEITREELMWLVGQRLQFTAKAGNKNYLLGILGFFRLQVFVGLFDYAVDSVFDEALHLPLQENVFDLIADDLISQRSNEATNFVGSK